MSGPNTAYVVPEGLPDVLPAGERMIWQGRPSPVALTLSAYKIHWLAAYFGVLFVWRIVSQLYDGATPLAAVEYAVWILPVAGLALAVFALLGWAAARSTTYTVTDRRVVMRIGVALSVTVNLPYKIVESASVKRRPDGSGDIAFRLEAGSRAGYALLWPHARPWRFGRPEPALRAIPNVDAVAARIAEALGGSAPTRVAAANRDTGLPSGLVAAE